MGKLNGSVAIVTGGGQGVGLGIATALAEAGAAVTITGRDGNKLDNAAERLRSKGADILTVPGDARNRTDALKAVEDTVQRFGSLNILVNNAQSSVPGTPLEEIDDDTVSLTLESGLLGTLYHMQSAFPHLKANGGSIINLGSREGIFGGVGFAIYAATKEGIRGMSRSAAREWGRYGIRVNVICPAALSPAAETYLAEHPEEAQMYISQTALGRIGDSYGDVAPVAVFLAAPESRYVTGQTLNVDGGQMML